MKTLGLIGGLSWYSTSVYYRLINQLTNQALGGSHSARLILHSIDFNDFKTLQEAGNWELIESLLTDIAQRLETAGANCIVMCTNTPHLVADGVSQKINIPLLHIAEETGKEVVKQNIKKAALLGTKFTMENPFFKERLAKFDIEVMIPNQEDSEFIHASIFNELTKGIFKEETKNRYINIIKQLQNNGAEGVIFGCTEIALLLTQNDCDITIFDTTTIHAKAAVNFALN